MRKDLKAVLLVAVSVLVVSVPVFAHHGSAVYDTEKTITVKGTVTEWFWANPHCFLKVDAKDDSGNTSHWIIETQSIVAQTDEGWSKTMFKPSDEVAIDVTPVKNFATHGTTVGRFKGRIVINGQVFQAVKRRSGE